MGSTLSPGEMKMQVQKHISSIPVAGRVDARDSKRAVIDSTPSEEGVRDWFIERCEVARISAPSTAVTGLFSRLW
jgi:hypothetical protein